MRSAPLARARRAMRATSTFFCPKSLHFRSWIPCALSARSDGLAHFGALILSFSGIWPYAKLFAMWSAWATPWATLENRRRLLERVDAAGKWSLIDVFVMMLFMVFISYFQVATSSGSRHAHRVRPTAKGLFSSLSPRRFCP